MRTQYAVMRWTKNEVLYGAVHGSLDGYETICCLKIDSGWWIIDNNYGVDPSCRKCKKILKNSSIEE
jgi:hypothetical protein